MNSKYRIKHALFLFVIIVMNTSASTPDNDNHYLEVDGVKAPALRDNRPRIQYETKLNQNKNTMKQASSNRQLVIIKTFNALLCRIPGNECHTFERSESPSFSPTESPSQSPTKTRIFIDYSMNSAYFPILESISCEPSLASSILPSISPSMKPSYEPSPKPTMTPTIHPSPLPSETPSIAPSYEPTNVLSSIPTFEASHNPSAEPTQVPSNIPSSIPSYFSTNLPSYSPSNHPSTFPTPIPTHFSSSKPSSFPTTKPSSKPSSYPSSSPSSKPSVHPSHSPSDLPSQYPSYNPSSKPSSSPTDAPTVKPSNQPSGMPIAEMEMCHFSIDIQDSDCSSHIVSNHGDRSKRTINRDEYICSLNKRYRFGLTIDENLCLCDGDRKLWCADECCQRGNDPYAVLESNGNLIVYSDKNRLRRVNVLWESNSGRFGPKKLKLFNNGDLLIVSLFDESIAHWKVEKDDWLYRKLSGT